MPAVRVQTALFSLAEAEALTDGRADAGALAVFVGRMRDFNDGAHVGAMELDHYPGMTETALEAIAAQAGERFAILDSLIIHRVGPIQPGEPIVLVAAISAHREEAFDACRFIMDFLKTDAPFWKRETGPQGARWVDARESDAAARARWTQD
jgi:molybdopterin synthase catalytic subunit